MSLSELAAYRLYNRCDPEDLPFETTDQVESATRFMGQPRAMEALRFGIGMSREGYNVFAFGETGIGKHTLIRQILDERAKKMKIPRDICYVNNFDEQHRPRLLKVSPGNGKKLAQDMKKLVDEIRNALRAAFESEEYQNRRQSITQELQEKQQEVFESLQRKAKENNLAPLRTPAGLVFAPVKDGEVVPPEQLENLSEEERKELEQNAESLQKEAQKFFQKIPQWQSEGNEKQKALDKEVSQYTVGPMIHAMIEKYGDNPDVTAYLKEVEKDIVENVQSFFQAPGKGQSPQAQQLQQLQHQLSGAGGPGGEGAEAESSAFRRYHVNVLVDHGENGGAPVIYEENPTYQNLFGRVEHLAQMGALVTDFNMIRPGALHRANGGFLIVDALKLLREPFAWEGVKRALRSGQAKIESLGQIYSLISTVSLEPEPMPLDVKVILTGDPYIYYLIRHYDAEFGEFFKVAADFAQRVDRNSENQREFAQLIASAVREKKLRPFNRKAVARVIEQSARMIGDAEKLSIHMSRITDLLQEADYWASEKGNDIVDAVDVQKAIDSWIFRSDRIRELMQEQIRRDIVFIDTQGEKAGQINGLAVIGMGDFSFGRPSRITARIRLGKGEVVDIEREVAMGGPIHTKGVLILTGFLGSRYAMERPLSLSASLVFEQSYSGIEGDSASSAELYALLSAISEVPIKQSFAVTGSVNQYGQVQPIGGVNEKIEGFFDICKSRGLTGQQGVLIPDANVKHLMLRQDVIEAVNDGRFHIYPVKTIDQGIELLTGIPAGEPDDDGRYPEDSVNGRVFKKLTELSENRLKFAQAAASKEGS